MGQRLEPDWIDKNRIGQRQNELNKQRETVQPSQRNNDNID